jgi:hypothetical protein
MAMPELADVSQNSRIFQFENTKLATYLCKYDVLLVWINASIVVFLSEHISFSILMTTFFKISFKIKKKRGLSHPYILYAILLA